MFFRKYCKDNNHMKNTQKVRFVLVILTLVSFTEFSAAQFFKASLLGGVNFAQVDGDHIGGYNKVGLNAGIGIYHDLNPESSVGFEIAFAQKGSKLVNDPDAVSPSIYIIKSSYVEFPLIYQRRLASVDALQLHTGLSIGVNISGTIDDGPRVSQANFQTLEMGFLLGGSYDLSDNLSFRVRHGYSLNKISTPIPNAAQTKGLFNRPGLFNRWFNVGFAYTLG